MRTKRGWVAAKRRRAEATLPHPPRRPGTWASTTALRCVRTATSFCTTTDLPPSVNRRPPAWTSTPVKSWVRPIPATTGSENTPPARVARPVAATDTPLSARNCLVGAVGVIVVLPVSFTTFA